MKYEALITDLDGTAVAVASSGEEIDAATQETVARAQDRGAKIGCATGRSWELARPVVKKLGLASLCVIEGGTRIIDPLSEESVWEKHLDDGVSNQILQEFKRYTRGGYIYMTGSEEELPLSGVSELPHSLRYLYLLDVAPDEAEQLINAINLEYQGRAVAHITPSWSGGNAVDVHVTHAEATKEHAVEKWRQLEGVAREHLIGMGDSGNDLPLFESSGFRVATGNAIPALKELADYVAPDCTDNALRHVIEEFFLDGTQKA